MKPKKRKSARVNREAYDLLYEFGSMFDEPVKGHLPDVCPCWDCEVTRRWSVTKLGIKAIQRRQRRGKRK